MELPIDLIERTLDLMLVLIAGLIAGPLGWPIMLAVAVLLIAFHQ